VGKLKWSDGKGIFGFVFGSSQRTVLIAICFLLFSGFIHLIDLTTLYHGFPRFLISTEFVSDVTKELGVAFLIAVVIVEGIERASRREQNDDVTELLNRIKTNVLEAVYGTRIAGVFFGPFRKIIDNPVLRRDCELSVNIELLSSSNQSISDSDVVTIDVDLTFEIVNCSKGDLPQAIPAHLETPWPSLAKLDLPYLGVKGVRLRLDGGSFEDLTVGRKASASPRNDLDIYEYTFDIPKGSSGWVIFSYRLVKYARDMSSFFTTIPTEDMRFEFYYDERLSLYYTNVHEADFLDETPPKSPGRLSLRSSGPLFPNNGIEFWWAPKSLGQAASGDKKAETPATSA
jgi:hypothetical protein